VETAHPKITHENKSVEQVAISWPSRREQPIAAAGVVLDLEVIRAGGSELASRFHITRYPSGPSAHAFTRRRANAGQSERDGG